MENIHTHFQWNNDPELNRLDSEVPFEKEPFRVFKERFEAMCTQPSPTDHDFEIHVKDGPLIGVAYVGHISEHNRHGTVSITIGDRDYWGQGYGRAALRLLLAYSFRELGLHRVRAEAFAYNAAWKRLLDGAGFTKEGVARDYLRRDGQYWDKVLYGLLAPEYTEHVAGGDGTAADGLEDVDMQVRMA
jgi:RimJ/RimL family protein N-acetyltransferase